MTEIKESEKGITYAKPTILKEKQRVYSEALLMKIPHKHTSEPDISLKIGRYRLPLSLESRNPKSELTLDNDELNALIKYVSESYKPIRLGAGEYISTSGDEGKLLISFKELISKKADVARLLIDNNILSEQVFAAAAFIKKQSAVHKFEEELKNTQPESFWQNWFASNKWLLGSEFIQIVNERDIDTANIADYLMRAVDGFVDLVEIKRPNEMLFWANTKDHNNYVPSSDLIKAITQCLNYLYAIEQEANSVKFIERIGCKVIKPRCTLVFGRSKEWNEEQKQAYRILNAAYNQLSIVTYDHLLLRAQSILK